MTALLIFMLISAAGLFFTWRLFRVFNPPTTYRGPKPSPEQERDASRFMTDHMIDYPGSAQTLSQHYPDEAKAAQAHRDYQALERLHQSGVLSDEEYARALEHIAAEINIDDITKGC